MMHEIWAGIMHEIRANAILPCLSLQHRLWVPVLTVPERLKGSADADVAHGAPGHPDQRQPPPERKFLATLLSRAGMRDSGTPGMRRISFEGSCLYRQV